ncbi:CSN-associated deubiquitinating enzyme Ubp12 [Orbilia oligospora]|uniref:ubiquitinyl hydrolase 1 n=1 Tax=Orbilia oligospora TaxID=2813651 RepID=A0A6G1MNU3_ORBOL|nr:CSN-associated deubiquitinating enzyme Ubp12 [Orbilia oligospora]KAF3264363.1 CSN-associated deubiquitinating enzyme Ubp12 [Orbilia oligospora]
MVESQAATPLPSQLDASENLGHVADIVNGIDKSSPEETQADKSEMDIDTQNPEKTAVIRRSPSIDMITSPPPTIEEPISEPAAEDLDSKLERIVGAANAAIEEGKKYYVVPGVWWKRFLAQASDYEPTKEDDFDPSQPVPPIDTTPLVSHVELLPNGKTFHVLRETAQMIVDFDIVPQAVWDELVRDYGLKENCPVLVREAINTADREAASKNITVDLNPPIYTVFMLTPSANITHSQLRESAQNKNPLKILIGKAARFQELLLDIKGQLGLEMKDKIRLWRFKESHAFKAPNTAKIDMNSFIEYEYGTNKEQIDLPDNTKQLMAGTYKSTMTLVEAGISQEKFLIVEVEEDGEWPSERVAKALKLNGANGAVVRVTKGTQVTQSVTSAKTTTANKAKATTAKASVLSAPVIQRNVMTRRDGRAAGAVGFSNLGNTCYMNSALQCIKSVEELSRYFIEGLHKRELNPRNPISSGGRIATMYAQLVGQVYSQTAGSTVAPREFKGAVGKHNTIFSGYGQQDSQEFVSYLLDILHEDLNRIHQKPVVEFPDSTDEMIGNPAAIAKLAEENWELYRKRNDSVIIDLFAGMYKSTVTCPICDKTSIKFDPWLSCQLPLPVENLWTKSITFVPAAKTISKYEKLVTVHVEMEKFATIKQLKDYVGTRVGVGIKKLVVSEVFRNKFYKHHEDNKTVSEAIMPNDQIYVYEVEETPTNFPPPKRKKQRTYGGRLTMSNMFMTSWDDDESEDDFEKTETKELLVPVFNRLYRDNRRMGADLFGLPSFIVLNREEQKDPDAILKKLVTNLQKFTTSDIYSPELAPKKPSQPAASTDTASSDSNTLDGEGEVVDMPTTTSKESDTDTNTEDFVDVKMGDAESDVNVEMSGTPATTTTMQSEIPSDLLALWRTLFNTKIMPRKGYVVLPTAWNGIELNLETMKSRIVEVPEPIAKSGKYLNSPPASDEDDEESKDDMESEEDVSEPAVLEKKGAFSTIAPSNFYGNGNKSASKKPVSKKAGKQPVIPDPVQPALIRLGEGIVCDWNQEAFDVVFGGRSGDSFRGASHFDAQEEFVDEDLLKKRKTREARRRRGIHIDDCFDEFGREEILNDDNQWYCPRCKEHRNAKKSMQIWRVPDIIALQFKRFSSTRSFRDKIDAAIDFPIEGLDLTGRVLESDGKSLIYDLIAVDNHFGGLGGGHYTANARNWVDKKWYYFDDSSARQTPASSINGSAAYLVFYRRRSSDILGGPTMEGMLETSINRNLDEESDDSPNGRGSPNGDPSSFSGARYSSGSQLASSSQYYSAGDGSRSYGVGGTSSSIRQETLGGVSRGVTSFASGQSTPPPEEKVYQSFQITSDDTYYDASHPSRPPLTSTTLFGSPSSGIGSSSAYRGSTGAQYDFGSSTGFGYGNDGGLDADDDDFGMGGPDSPTYFQDSEDEEVVELIHGPRPFNMMSPGYFDTYDSDSNVPGSGTLSFAPTYTVISRNSLHVKRYEDVRAELMLTLSEGSYAMTLVMKKMVGPAKPCVLIITDQLALGPELEMLCGGMGLEMEIIDGDVTFNYELPVPIMTVSPTIKGNNDVGVLIGPADGPGRFSAVSLYVRDKKAPNEVYALTTASAFALREPETQTNIPPRLLTALLPEGSIVNKFTGQEGAGDAFGTLTGMCEFEIVEVGLEEEATDSAMLNYALVKVNNDKAGSNAVHSRGIKRPVSTIVGVESVPEKMKVVVVQGAAGGGQKEAKYNAVVVDVHDTARFPQRPFQMYALFGEGRDLITPGILGAVCCSPQKNNVFAASGIVAGRAKLTGGYGEGGSILQFVDSVDWILERIRVRFDVELEVLPAIP